MNEYEVDTADYVEDRRTHVTDLVKQTRCVQAHSAADALTCFERNNPGETITGIRCVERPGSRVYRSAIPPARLDGCEYCDDLHPAGAICPSLTGPWTG